VALLPGGAKGRAAWTGSPTFAIPTDCPDPHAAAQVLQFLLGIEAQGFEAGNGAVPSRRSAFEMEKEHLREGTIGHLRFTLAEQSFRVASLVPPAVPQYLQLEERVWPHLQAGYLGDRETAEALEAAYRAAAELFPAPQA
jgi:ABC-type glycerol-3-phosphate transport system substrate-binding protein